MLQAGTLDLRAASVIRAKLPQRAQLGAELERNARRELLRALAKSPGACEAVEDAHELCARFGPRRR